MSDGCWVYKRPEGPRDRSDMDFDSSRALKNATGRAKSDVANKLVSMFLHEVSRKACIAGGLTVSDVKYRESVTQQFGNRCIYCDRALERDRVAVEHLEGMNRFRAGLHTPGNVAMACRRCNTEKRRDDQNPSLSLAQSGWESFLSHDETMCLPGCKSCAYWTSVIPDVHSRATSMGAARNRILTFQEPYHRFTKWASNARPSIKMKVETLYRECQNFATSEIDKLTSELKFDFQNLSEDSFLK